MVEAAVQAGFPRNPSFDSGTLDGAGWNKSTIANGERFNAYRAFVAPVLDRPNLHVLTDTRVLRLAIEGNRARGVVVQRDDGSLETITAGEVIVCAGAFDSPRLLLLSGIGPAAQLERLGIAPVADLPVGENLIDHLLIGIVYDSLQPISDCNAYCHRGLRLRPLDAGPRRLRHPDLVRQGAPLRPGDERRCAPLHDHPRHHPPEEPRHGPPDRRRSRCAARDRPLLLRPPRRHAAMIRAVRLSREIAEQAALAAWNAGEHFPGPAVADDDEIAAYVARDVSTWFHPVGTCRMGVGADAVVDPALRVHGIAGLRVADASIMPDIVSVNTNAASTMIGWKAGGHVLA